MKRKHLKLKGGLGMIALKRTCVAAVVSASLATVGWAGDTVKGTGSLGAEKASFAHGMGIFTGKSPAVLIGFFAKPLSASDQAGALKEGLLNVGQEPYLVLRLSFPEGAKTAAHLDRCEVDFFNFKQMQQVVGSSASECGVTELGGDLRAGGVVHGKLKMDRPQGKTWDWDLEFTSTLLRATK
jgi:hypothetical protein